MNTQEDMDKRSKWTRKDGRMHRFVGGKKGGSLRAGLNSIALFFLPSFSLVFPMSSVLLRLGNSRHC